MSLIQLPEGVEVDLKVYIVGMVEDQEVELVMTVGGLPVFSDSIRQKADLANVIANNNLNDLGTDWRVMTRDEIADFKARERAREEIEAP